MNTKLNVRGLLLLISLFLSHHINAQPMTQEEWEEFQRECLELFDTVQAFSSEAISYSSLKSIKDKNPKVIVLGEYHYDHLFWKMPHIFRYLRKLVPQTNCLYSEISQDATEAEIQEAINGVTNRIFHSQFRLGFGPLYESIYEQGGNVVLVDAPLSEIDFTDSDTMATWLYRRDSFMISRIEDSIRNQECTGGIYNVGAQHIRDFEDYDSFGSRLKSQRDETVIIEKAFHEKLNQCSMYGLSEDINAFIVPATNQDAREFFEVDEGSSGDYILFVPESKTLNTLISTPVSDI